MRLRELRKQRNLNQQVIADVLNCSQSVYSRYENGSYAPSLEILIKLADFFQVSLDELVGRTPIPVTPEPPPPQDPPPPQAAAGLETIIREVVRQELEKRGL